MASQLSRSKPRADRKVPLLVVLVILYQLAKAVFFGWVFWQCWAAQGSGVPPFGEADAHNPFFEAPLFFVFAALGVFQFVVGMGLLSLGNWARACATLPLISVLPWWILERVMGYTWLAFPVEFSAMLAVCAAEAIALAILYGTAESRAAFAPAEESTD
jgi:hypothetical protein